MLCCAVGHAPGQLLCTIHKSCSLARGNYARIFVREDKLQSDGIICAARLTTLTGCLQTCRATGQRDRCSELNGNMYSPQGDCSSVCGTFLLICIL